ncbi:MAG: UDP-galactopyranose mutase [Bacteroidetes bacterium]|nr:UDP-galactopyranose mutase [Bacteroidota bacterium]
MPENICVIGCGFSGAISARILAEAGYQVHIFEKRNHIGGNAYDKIDENGIVIHPYGPHIFHTNNKRVFKFLSKFTTWRFYEHEVLAYVDGKEVPIPINRVTLSEIYGKDFTEKGAKLYFSENAVKITNIRNSEDNVLASVGEDLCDKIFRGYTRKQWGMDLADLDASVAARIPTRTNDDCRYFVDDFQFIPANGYTALFEKILDHRNISINLNTDYFDHRDSNNYMHTIYSGPIDKYFDYQFGKLEYRSLNFKHTYIPNLNYYQKVGTINYPNEYDYTRITEFKHITGQKCTGTSIVKEFPKSHGDPYYPVPRPRNNKVYTEYYDLAKLEQDVTFIGRLAQYKYYNMDQVIASSISKTNILIEQLKKS